MRDEGLSLLSVEGQKLYNHRSTNSQEYPRKIITATRGEVVVIKVNTSKSGEITEEETCKYH